MFRNYFITGWRNLVHNKAYSALNIVGLAIGMAVALILGLWVEYHYSYDRYLPGYRQVYQAHLRFTRNGVQDQMSATCIPMSDALRKDIPEIAYAVHTDGLGEHGLMVGEKRLTLSGTLAEKDFFKVFPFPAVAGNLDNALANTYSIVLTESTAKSLFGNDDPLGKSVRYDNEHDLVVTAVIRDVPPNSTMSFNFIVPFEYGIQNSDWIKQASTTWNNNSFSTYVALKPNITYAQIEPKLSPMYDKYVPEAKNLKPGIFLYPMTDWHLYGDFKNGVADGGFIEYVRLFSIIGILVLLIACVNFMNLATARSEKRAREVGVRKAIGSRRKNLIAQFLIESLIITFAAALLSLIIVQVAVGPFNQLTSSHIAIPWASPVFWSVMAGYVLVTGLFAGSRPAFYLSSFQPVKVLKGAIQAGRSATLPRKALVVLQFSCSIALIISTFLIYQQIQHAKDRPKGYDSARLMMTQGSNDLYRNYKALKNDMLRSGLVTSVTRASGFVTGLGMYSMVQDWPGKLPDETLSSAFVRIDDDYFGTLGMQLVAGRGYTGNVAADSSDIILNEAAVKRLRLKDPIGQTITWQMTPHRIVGVVKDALMANPFSPAQPTFFSYQPARTGDMLYRLAPDKEVHDAIAGLGAMFGKYSPTAPYDYHFADDSYARKFRLEELIGQLAALFAGLAIFISCLGLFGLAAYMAEQRMHEIGIRKVLGASVSQLWLLLSGDFILLVLISCVVASPPAYYFLHGWLEKYEYRITIGPGVFVMAAVIALSITVLTISYQAIRGAMANPVKSLRRE